MEHTTKSDDVASRPAIIAEFLEDQKEVYAPRTIRSRITCAS